MELVKRKAGHALVRVQPGLWQLVFLLPSPTNCWLWQERDGITLIDAGHPWNTASILEAAEYLGQPVKRILLTHAHPDHAGAAAQVARVTGALVCAHESEAEFLLGERSLADLPGFWMCRALLSIGKHFRLVDPPPLDQLEVLVEGDKVGRLQVIHTPGHTPGSVSFWSPQDKALFCGDNVCSSMGKLHVGLPWFTLDLPRQRASLSKYAELPAQILLSGHGPAYRGDVSAAMKRLLPSAR